MSRIDNINKSFEDVANMAFDNLPEWIAIIQLLYIRDLNDRSEYQDGRIINSFMMSWCHLYDIASARELLLNKFNSTEQV